MPDPGLNKELQNISQDFTLNIENIYKDNLVSVILYGSAASGEFINKHSNLNVLVVLKNADLDNLARASGLINKRRFRLIHPLFLSESYIRSSNDVFPIEFLDMKENYTVLSGSDALKNITIDTRNLRFQCEQELKAKIIALKQCYLRNSESAGQLSASLLKAFTSITHILRNVLRIKGRQPPYLKQDILKDLEAEFQIDKAAWEKILAAKNKQVKLNAKEAKRLFVNFVKDVEEITNFIDTF
ncbi:MAG: hypothetical protein WC723_03920 [Candidatus Omnitrophota bacterium]